MYCFFLINNSHALGYWDNGIPYYYPSTLLPVGLDASTDPSAALIYFIRQYIHTQDKDIRRAINFLYPTMEYWEITHFKNFMDQLDEREYSSDEEQPVNSRSVNPTDKDLAQSTLNAKKHPTGWKSLEKTVQDYINKVLNSHLTKPPIENFTTAKDRRAFFPALPQLSAIQKYELDLINQSLKPDTSIRLQKVTINGKTKIKVNGDYDGKKIDYMVENNYYLPCFRGISYLVDRWSAPARRAHRKLERTNDFAYFSESVIQTTDQNFYQLPNYSQIDRAAMHKNARALKTRLLDFRLSNPIILSHKENREFNNFLDYLQYAFSNGIKNFLQHLKEFNKSNVNVLPNSYNPFVPFSHLPYHSMLYAMGEKNPYSPFALPPLWDRSGRCRKPYIGKITTSIHPLQDFLQLDEPDVVPYLNLSAGVTPGPRIGPEYEISFLGYLPAERIFKTRVIRWPSFHRDYNENPDYFLSEFGLTKSLYDGFRRGILTPELQNQTIEWLRAWLCMFHAIKLMQEVKKEVEENLQGTLIFRHPDGSYHQNNYPLEATEYNDIKSQQKRNADQHIAQGAIKHILTDSTSYSETRRLSEVTVVTGVYQTPTKSRLPKQPLTSSPEQSSTSPYTTVSSSGTPSSSVLDDLPISLARLTTDESFSFSSPLASPLPERFSAFSLGDSLSNLDEFIVSESVSLAQAQGHIGPRTLEGWDLYDVNDNGNCFYEAVADQLIRVNHQFLAEVPAGTTVHDSLRLRAQGQDFQDRQWADDEHIKAITRKLNIIIGIVDTRNPTGGFIYYYLDEEQQYITHLEGLRNLPNRQIIRLAYTGNHFLSVRNFPAIALSSTAPHPNKASGIPRSESIPNIDSIAPPSIRRILSATF